MTSHDLDSMLLVAVVIVGAIVVVAGFLWFFWSAYRSIENCTVRELVQFASAITCAGLFVTGIVVTVHLLSFRPRACGHALHATPENSETVHNLTVAEEARFSACREIVEASFDAEDVKQHHRLGTGKLGLLDALLRARDFSSHQTNEVQGMGLVLGDVLVEELGLRWVVVAQGRRRRPAVVLNGTTAFVYPLSMISRPLERGEDVNVFDLFRLVSIEVAALKQSADVR